MQKKAAKNAEDGKNEAPHMKAEEPVKAILTNQPAAKGAEDERVLSAIAYIGLISVIVYLIYKDKGNKFVRFHAIQGMLLFAAVFLIDLCLAITIIGIILIPFVFLGYLITVVLMAVKAYGGERKKLPIIGEIADKKA
jgi:uncharacterized membrane protein